MYIWDFEIERDAEIECMILADWWWGFVFQPSWLSSVKGKFDKVILIELFKSCIWKFNARVSIPFIELQMWLLIFRSSIIFLIMLFISH